MGIFNFNNCISQSVSMNGNSVKVNGRTIQVPEGSSVSIINGDVFIDGKQHEFDDDFKVGTLIIEGNCGNIKTDGNLTVRGLGGDAHASGNINCGDIDGDCRSGGNINCGNIKGSVRAGGNINRR